MNQHHIIVTTSIPAILGYVLSEYREKASLSQTQLSELMEISKSSLSRIEKGETSISIEQLFRFADVLGILPSDILGGVESAIKEAREKGLKIVSSKNLEGCLGEKDKKNNSIDVSMVGEGAVVGTSLIATGKILSSFLLPVVLGPVAVAVSAGLAAAYRPRKKHSD